MFCIKLLGNGNFEAPVLCQAIGELLSAGSGFASSYWGITLVRVLLLVSSKLLRDCDIEALVLCRAAGLSLFRLQLLYIALSCGKLLGDCNYQAFVLPQALGGVQLRVSCLVSSY